MREGFKVALTVQPFIQIDRERSVWIGRDIPPDTAMHGLKVNKVVNALDKFSQSGFASFFFIRFNAASRIALAGASFAASNRIFISGRSNAS